MVWHFRQGMSIIWSVITNEKKGVFIKSQVSVLLQIRVNNKHDVRNVVQKG